MISDVSMAVLVAGAATETSHCGRISGKSPVRARPTPIIFVTSYRIAERDQHRLLAVPGWYFMYTIAAFNQRTTPHMQIFPNMSGGARACHTALRVPLKKDHFFLPLSSVPSSIKYWWQLWHRRLPTSELQSRPPDVLPLSIRWNLLPA